MRVHQISVVEINERERYNTKNDDLVTTGAVVRVVAGLQTHTVIALINLVTLATNELQGGGKKRVSEGVTG